MSKPQTSVYENDTGTYESFTCPDETAAELLCLSQREFEFAQSGSPEVIQHNLLKALVLSNQAVAKALIELGDEVSNLNDNFVRK